MERRYHGMCVCTRAGACVWGAGGQLYSRETESIEAIIASIQRSGLRWRALLPRYSLDSLPVRVPVFSIGATSDAVRTVPAYT